MGLGPRISPLGVHGVLGASSDGMLSRKKVRVVAMMKIVEFRKENIGFQWSWWVPERPESGPRGHRNTPRAASEDQMDSWEVPGERPEAVWRRFGSSRGAFEALSESVFQPKK